MMPKSRSALLLAAVAGASGCSLAPHYRVPTVAGAAAPQWKTVNGWRPASPADDAVRADWWTAYGDPMLDGLVAQAAANNQTLAQQVAAYRQAVAATRLARASLFPTVSANGSVTHSYSGNGRVITGDVISSTTSTGASSATGTSTSSGTGSNTGTSSGTTSSGTNTAVLGNGSNTTNYRLSLQATWTPDFFGSVVNTVRNARYTEQSQLAAIANTRLVIEGELVSDYLSLREADADVASLAATVDAYRRSLQIASNQYGAGIVARTDVFQAQSQLASAQADLESETQTRAQFEDAIAVLVGENPAGFRIASLGANWRPTVPDVPVALPSALLERRPDIATAERQVAAANAQIGVQRAAYFPTVTLTGSGGFESDSLGAIFNAASTLWSVGAQAAETLLDFGARRARVQQARAQYDASVANYRQVTLTAFQEVQDDLVAVEVLGRREAFLRAASIAADQSEQSLRNQYLAGTTVYSNVVTAQATALADRRALLQGELDRQNAAAALVQALGGGWTTADLAARPGTAAAG